MGTRERRGYVEPVGDRAEARAESPAPDGEPEGDGVLVRGKTISVGWAMFFGFVMAVVSGVGSTVTWKVSTDGVNARQDEADVNIRLQLADHEARMRALETSVVGGLAEIRAQLAEIKGRLK